MDILRPQRSISVSDFNLTPAMARETCSIEGKRRIESLVTSEEASNLSSDGPLAEGRGKGNGKEPVMPKDVQNLQLDATHSSCNYNNQNPWLLCEKKNSDPIRNKMDQKAYVKSCVQV